MTTRTKVVLGSVFGIILLGLGLILGKSLWMDQDQAQPMKESAHRPAVAASGPRAGQEPGIPRLDAEQAGVFRSIATAEDLVRMMRAIPLGNGNQDVQAVFPNLGPMQPEGGIEALQTANGLKEANARIQVFGRPTEIEFNFRHGTLYSANMTLMRSPQRTEAENFYADLKQGLMAELGGREETVEQDVHETYRSIAWELRPNALLRLILITRTDSQPHTVAIGLQKNER